MFPDPIHPALVHLPIALAALLPLLTLGAMIYISRSGATVPVWGLVVIAAGLLLLGGWAAAASGEQDEERVERVVAEAPIEAHEEAAEVFIALAASLFGVTLIGLAPGQIGTFGRGLAVVVSLLVLGSGIRVGHLGGQLVYTHGAAQAHVARLAGATPLEGAWSLGHAGADSDVDSDD